jgi:hypothetical protein
MIESTYRSLGLHATYTRDVKPVMTIPHLLQRSIAHVDAPRQACTLLGHVLNVDQRLQSCR